MTTPLRRIAAGLSLLAAAFLLVAALLPADANAQSPPVKRAAPTSKAKAKDVHSSIMSKLKKKKSQFNV